MYSARYLLGQEESVLLLALLKTMRPHQWTKNVFIFGALAFDQKLFDIPSLLNTLIGFAILCFISGTVYIVNDLVDVEKDRLHPKKRTRPIASGVLGIQAAIVSAFIFPLLLLPLSFWLNITFGLLMILYLGLQFAYSFKLKNIVIIDVMIIAAGFVIRVGAGVSLVEVTRFSPWLYVCMTLLGLFMGFGKRRQELFLLQEEAKNTRTSLSDYSIQFLDEIITIVAASTIMAYALYTFSAPGLPDNHTMMLTIPFVIYAIFRYLHLLHVQGNSGDPSEILLHDRPLQLTVIFWGVTVIIILYRQAFASLFNL